MGLINIYRATLGLSILTLSHVAIKSAVLVILVRDGSPRGRNYSRCTEPPSLGLGVLLGYISILTGFQMTGFQSVTPAASYKDGCNLKGKPPELALNDPLFSSPHSYHSLNYTWQILYSCLASFLNHHQNLLILFLSAQQFRGLEGGASSQAHMLPTTR